MSELSKMNILTMGEKDTLVECEKIIQNGQQTFVEVGFAITKIRDKKLYRIGHATFEDYCQNRWGWTRQHAGRLIEASEVVKSLPAKCNQLVTNESTARAVADVPKEQRAAVVEQAAKDTGGRVTAKAIEKAAEVIHDAEIIPTDENGTTIPLKIRALWKESQHTVNELLPLSRSLKSAFKIGVETKETNLIWIECNNTDGSPVQNIINTLTLHIAPHAVCYVCNGANPSKCKLCKGRGFIGKHLWTTCPEETKKLIGKAAK